jgi:hypothetical protein
VDLLDRVSTAVAFFAFIYLYSNLGVALPKVWQFPLSPGYFYVPIAIFAGTILAISPGAIEAFLQHRIFIFTLLAYGFLEGARLVFNPPGEIPTQVLISNSEYILLTIACLVIFSLCKRLDRIIQVVGLVVAVSAGINLIEYYLPQLLPVTFTTFTTVPGTVPGTVPPRVAGFFGNANGSAMYICLPLPLVTFFAPRLVRYMWYAIALAGTVVTFSRGGMVLWVVAVVVTEALKQRERAGLRFTGMILLTMQFLFVALVLAYAVSAFGGMDALFPHLNDATRARVNFTADDNGRLYVAEQGIDMFFDAPLFGNGVGSSRVPPDNGPHNMLVLMLAELGLVGGIWIAAFLLSIARYGVPFGLLLAIMYSVSAPFTHNYLEDAPLGMLFALYLVAAKRYEKLKAAQEGVGKNV